LKERVAVVVDAHTEWLYRRVLNLPTTDATAEDVRRCYRREMRRWHPDVGGDGERARLLNLARDYWLRYPHRITLRDPEEKPAPAATTSQVSTAVPVPSCPPRTLDGISKVVLFAVAGYCALLTFAVIGWLASVILTVALQ